METTMLPATLVVAAPAIAPAAVIQMLEGQSASGTLRAGAAWLRLREGRVVSASGDPVATVAILCAHEGLVTFRAVRGIPSGELSLSPTALLLEAARLSDEGQRQTA